MVKKRVLDLADLASLAGFVHFAFASVMLLRPNLSELYPLYSAFDTPLHWGYVQYALAFAMLLTPRDKPAMLAWSFLSALIFASLSVMFYTAAGLNTGTTTYGILATASLIVFGRTWSEVIVRHYWFNQLVKNPPGSFPVGKASDGGTRDGK